MQEYVRPCVARLVCVHFQPLKYLKESKNYAVRVAPAGLKVRGSGALLKVIKIVNEKRLWLNLKFIGRTGRHTSLN